MFAPMTPAQFATLSTSLTRLMWDAQTVVAYRMMGIGGVIPARDNENRRMVSEKSAAFQKAWIAGTKAAMAGKRSDQIASAALAPISRTAKANRKRLSKA